VLVAGNKPAGRLSLASDVIAILLVAIPIPLRRLDPYLTVAANKVQDGVSIGIIIVIRLHRFAAVQRSCSGDL
jgi:hypothetical protein